MYSKEKLRVRKLVLVLATFMPIITARKEIVENAGPDKNGENPGTISRAGENCENLIINLAQVPYI